MIDQCSSLVYSAQRLRHLSSPSFLDPFIQIRLFPYARRLAAMNHPEVRRRLLVVLVLLLSLDGGLGDAVQVTLAGLGDAAATLVVVGLKDTDLLEGLTDLAVNGSGGVDVVGGAVAAVLGATVDLAQTANTDGLAHVDVAGDGSSAHVVPEVVLVGIQDGILA